MYLHRNARRRRFAADVSRSPCAPSPTRCRRRKSRTSASGAPSLLRVLAGNAASSDVFSAVFTSRSPDEPVST
jgi:hypothetical protein